MSAATQHGHSPTTAPYYFVPAPSSFPVMASVGLFFVILGAGQWVNGAAWGAYSLALRAGDVGLRDAGLVPHGHPRKRKRPLR